MRGLVPDEMVGKAIVLSVILCRRVYLSRSGVQGIEPDEQIRNDMIAYWSEALRQKYSGFGPGCWFQEESELATILHAINMTIDGNPNASPTRSGEHGAEQCRPYISTVLSDEGFGIRTRVKILIDNRGHVLNHAALDCGMIGPVFAESFLNKYNQILNEEMSSCAKQ